jgi:hypothetical protein
LSRSTWAWLAAIFFRARHGFLGPILLHEAHQGVQQHNGQNHVSRFHLAHHARQDGRRDEHQNHHVGELVEQQLPHRLPPGIRNLVGAVLGQALPGRGRGEAGRRGAERAGNFFNGDEVVVHQAGAWGGKGATRAERLKLPGPTGPHHDQNHRRG